MPPSPQVRVNASASSGTILGWTWSRSMLKPEGFFSFGGGGVGASGVPDCRAAGPCVGPGGGAGTVERPPFRSACFFRPIIADSPLLARGSCRSGAHLTITLPERKPQNPLLVSGERCVSPHSPPHQDPSIGFAYQSRHE